MDLRPVWVALGFLSMPFATEDGTTQDLSLAEAKEAFAVADRALNEAYREAREALAPYLFEELRDEQRAWLAERDERSANVTRWDSQVVEGNVEGNPGYWIHLEGLTLQRLMVVQAWALDGTFEKVWEGAWTDGEGGLLLIEEGEGKEIRFRIDVVRGPTYHIGNIGGVARSLAATARFATQAEGEEEETWITFLQEGRKLRVIGENTQYFHGMRAYFDGDYFRFRGLLPEDREEIAEASEGMAKLP